MIDRVKILKNYFEVTYYLSTMNTITLLLMGLLVSISNFAQTDPYETFAIQFVEHYNTQHFDRVYALTAPGFQQKEWVLTKMKKAILANGFLKYKTNPMLLS